MILRQERRKTPGSYSIIAKASPLRGCAVKRGLFHKSRNWVKNFIKHEIPYKVPYNFNPIYYRLMVRRKERACLPAIMRFFQGLEREFQRPHPGLRITCMRNFVICIKNSKGTIPYMGRALKNK